MATNPYGQREGNIWVRLVDLRKHLFRSHKGFGFHLHFRAMFANDPTLEGCRIVEEATGRTWYIDREQWLSNAKYVTQPKPQYVIPLAAFRLIDQGRIKQRKGRGKQSVQRK